VRLLIDTQVILWGLNDDKRLGGRAKEMLGGPDVQVLASVASLWEVAIKHGLGKLPANARQVAAWLEDLSIDVLQISLAHLNALEQLPHIHRDPFDRLIIAQAVAEDLAILTSDPQIMTYDINTIPAQT
jgi:PIN domain nuclease of toxin-antitoxin system